MTGIPERFLQDDHPEVSQLTGLTTDELTTKETAARPAGAFFTPILQNHSDFRPLKTVDM
jgi:hypothetical protein